MRGVKKENLPSKVCVTCGRPFTWRKKWENCWDEVSTCSKSCNRKRREAKQKSKEEEEEEQDEGGRETSSEIASFGSKSGEEEQRIFQSMGEQLDSFNQSLEIETLDAGDSTEHISVEEERREEMDPVALRKAERKAAKKARKAERRAQRQGKGDPAAGQKDCDMCGKSVDLLVRCKHADSNGSWEMVCGKCWNHASGGVVDGDSNHPDYHYGGLWKNRRKQSA